MEDGEAHTFYYALKSLCTRGSVAAVQCLRTDQAVWKNVRSIIETKLLGWSRDADFDLMQELYNQRHGHRADESNRSLPPKSSDGRHLKPHRAMIKAKVVAAHGQRAPVSHAELLHRCAVLPFLEDNSLLFDGDTLVLWRVPVDYDDMRRIYRKKRKFDASEAAAAAALEPSYQSLLRLPEVGTDYRDVPVLFGRHQWLAAAATVDASADATDSAAEATTKTPLFDDSMTEDQRMAAIIEQAENEFEFTAEDQAKHMQSMRSGKQRFGHGRPKTRLPPDNYVCARCKVPGHWLHLCPTRNDSRYDQKNILSTNGVPKRQLIRIQMNQLGPEYKGNIYRDQLGKFYIKNESIRDNTEQISSALFRLAVPAARAEQ